MPEYKISSAVASNLKAAMTDFAVDAQRTDGPSDQKETKWFNDKWSTHFGYYTDEKVPEITAVIDGKASWTVGKGFKADEVTTMLLDTIKGNGFDTFNTILENVMRTMLIGGNFYAHIIRDEEENLINLKPLEPITMVNIAAADGIIIEAKGAGAYNHGYGNLIKIQHYNGTTTVYGHLSGLSVKEGDKVYRGDLIGKMGNTGNANCCHLHFEVRGAQNPFVKK